MATHSSFPSTVLSARCGFRYACALACPEKDRAHQRNYKRKAQSRGAFLILFPFTPLPELPSDVPRSGRLPQPSSGPPPNIRGGEETQDRLTALLVGKEVLDFELVLTSLPVSLRISTQRVLLLAFPVCAALGRCSRVWVLEVSYRQLTAGCFFVS